MSGYLLERAWITDRWLDDVLVQVADGRFTTVRAGACGVSGTAEWVPGLTIPGLANTHSHAFHRGLRGRTQRDHGTFWTWREQMYAVAARLDPDTYYRLARATYAEMAAAGITSVGEFHYLHHEPAGTPYADANAMSAALVAAAREVGIRIALLDTLYLSSGFGAAPAGAQIRYSDGDPDRWRARVDEFVSRHEQDPAVVVGAAAHSVRAVPTEALPALRDLAESGVPVHVHLSEQVQENRDCLAHYGVTPTRLLADHGLLGPMTSLVHATHLTDEDIALIGDAGAFASFCPTTERDLGDGIGPGRRLAAAGATLTLGSDSHAVIDLFEEMRALELDERLATQERGHWPAADLLLAGTVAGHRSLGFADAGEIAVGHRADLVTIDAASPRTAGTGRDEHTVAFAAVAEDVTRVVADGRVVFQDADRRQVGAALDQEMTALWKGIDP